APAELRGKVRSACDCRTAAFAQSSNQPAVVSRARFPHEVGHEALDRSVLPLDCRRYAAADSVQGDHLDRHNHGHDFRAARRPGTRIRCGCRPAFLAAADQALDRGKGRALVMPGIACIVTRKPRRFAEAELQQMLTVVRHESFYAVRTW